jgi:hypothetical protein
VKIGLSALAKAPTAAIGLALCRQCLGIITLTKIRAAEMAAAAGVLQLAYRPLDLLFCAGFFMCDSSATKKTEDIPRPFDMRSMPVHPWSKTGDLSGCLEVFRCVLARAAICDDVIAELLTFQQEAHP